MTPDRPQKIKLLRLLDLLQRETDVDHPISRQDLCQRLNDMGISSNLRTLSLDIETLNDAGYEVMENQVGHEKYYERIVTDVLYEYVLDIWGYGETDIKEQFLKAKIFEGKSFWEIESELKWLEE